MSARTTRRRTRRSPLRRAALIGAALTMMGGLSALAAPTPSAASPVMPSDISAGQALFSTNCSSCHGMNGEGVTLGGTQIGPNIQNVGAAAVDFQVSSGRMPMAGQAIQAPRKTNTFSEDEIKAMAAYVASLGSGPGIPTADQYSTSGLTAEEIAKGGELFRTNCSACHNYAGKGGALSDGNYAPPLTGTGVTDKQIWEAMRTGPQNMPVFNSSNISDDEARAIIAYVTQLNSSPDSGGYSLGGVGPVTEGAAVWILGIGSLVGFALWIASKGARAR